RRLVVGIIEIAGESIGALEQPDAEALAAAVRLQDHRTGVEMATRRRSEVLLPGDQHGSRGANPGRFQRGILPGLADFEIERARSVDDTPAMPGQPSQYRGGKFGGGAVDAGLGG